jgi:hypothetical protein
MNLYYIYKEAFTGLLTRKLFYIHVNKWNVNKPLLKSQIVLKNICFLN